MAQVKKDRKILAIIISLIGPGALLWASANVPANSRGERLTSVFHPRQNISANFEPGKANGQTSDEEEIRLVVEKANRAFQDGDAEVIRSLTADDPNTHLAEPQTFRKIYTDPLRLRIESFEIRRVTIEGDHAVCRVLWQRRDPRTQQPVSGYSLNHMNAYLQKYGGQWKMRGFLAAESDFATAVLAARTVEARRVVLASEPELDAGESLIHLAFRLSQDGKYDTTAEVLTLTRWLAHERNDQALLARAILNEGLLQVTQGNQHDAFVKFQEAQHLSDELVDRAGQARALESISELYLQQGNLSLALDYAFRALDQIKDENETANRVTLLLANKTIGDAYLAQKEYDKALQSYQKNFVIDARYGAFPGGDIQVGLINLQQGNIAAATQILERALLVREPEGGAPGTGVDRCFLLSKIAELQVRQGDAESALISARRAVAIAHELRNLDLLWVAENAEGLALIALKQNAAAQLSFQQAIAAIEAERITLAGTEQAYRQFLTSHTAPYQSLISLLLAEGKNAEALAVAERGKARVLADVLGGGRINIDPWMNGSERTKDQQLKTQLAHLNRQLTLEGLKPFPDSTTISALTAQQEKARLTCEDWQTKVAAAHPQLRLAVSDLPAMSLVETSQLLHDKSEALLEYVVTDDQVSLFVLTQDSSAALSDSADLHVYHLAVTPKNLLAQVQDFHRRLSERDAEFRTQARDLYQSLLAPAEAQLQGRGHLILVPDRELWGVPFQALMPDANHYLIEQAAISYAPSLTALREMRVTGARVRGSRAPAGSLLALGNPQLSSDTISTTKAQYRDGKLGPLPEAEKEVIAIGRLYRTNSSVFTGARASEDLLKREVGRYRYLHLATHGVANADNPLYSHVLLAPGKTGSEDGWLEAWEIMRLELHAEMVVLSACETASGRISAGEGVIGLSWAFMIAGAPTTVVSQWNVDSSSTGELMLEFYRQLRAPGNNRSLPDGERMIDTKHASVNKQIPVANALPISKAEALRRAELKLLRQPETAHPFYWSAFAVVGDAR
jgi:CHAT domain-containing protein